MKKFSVGKLVKHGVNIVETTVLVIREVGVRVRIIMIIVDCQILLVKIV
jgi:hypothetical protein